MNPPPPPYKLGLKDNMIRSGHRRFGRSFNLCHRKIDISTPADYLDLTFIILSGGKLSTRLFNKRDDFDFHIVNLPFLFSNLPSGPSYGVYILQLIRYARCWSHHYNFRYRHKCLVDRLLSQGCIALWLEKSFKKRYGRYQNLIDQYQRSAKKMVNDSFPR